MPEPRALHPSSKSAQPQANPNSEFPKQSTLVDGQISSVNADNPWKAGPKVAAMLSRISAIVLNAKASGRYAKEIEPYLSPEQKTVLEKMIFANPPLPIQEAMATVSARNPSARRHMIVYKLLAKLERWGAGTPLNKMQHRHGAADRVKRAIEERLASGETPEQLKKNLKFCRTESMVIDLYILPEKRPKQAQVAEKIGVSNVTVSKSLVGVYNKLRGLNPREHYFAKYRGMSDDEIRQAIASSGAKTPAELNARNYALGFIARERGIMWQVFKIEKGGHARKIRERVHERMKTDSLKAILSELSPLEREIVLRRALSGHPLPLNVLAKKHGTPQAEAAHAELCLAAKILASKDLALSAKKEPFKTLDKESLERFRLALNQNELAVLERRILNPKLETLAEIGRSLSLSREAMRQTEEKLLKKAALFSEHGSIAFRKRGSRTESLQLLRETAAKLTVEQIEQVRPALDLWEIAALERRALSIHPETRVSVAESLSLSNSALFLAERRLIKKLNFFLLTGQLPLPKIRKSRTPKIVSHAN